MISCTILLIYDYMTLVLVDYVRDKYFYGHVSQLPNIP
jgi:hypothetical protein